MSEETFIICKLVTFTLNKQFTIHQFWIIFVFLMLFHAVVHFAVMCVSCVLHACFRLI